MQGFGQEPQLLNALKHAGEALQSLVRHASELPHVHPVQGLSCARREHLGGGSQTGRRRSSKL
eukprot:7222411-Pyramimonas_sp.AAC.1